MCPSAANDAERFFKASKLRLSSEVTETLTWETPMRSRRRKPTCTPYLSRPVDSLGIVWTCSPSQCHEVSLQPCHVTSISRVNSRCLYFHECNLSLGKETAETWSRIHLPKLLTNYRGERSGGCLSELYSIPTDMLEECVKICDIGHIVGYVVAPQ